MPNFLQDFLQAIPSAAVSPFALTAYAIAAILFVFEGKRFRTVSKLLNNIKALPKEERSRSFAIATNTILPNQISPEQWIEDNKRRSRTAIIIALLICLLVVVIVAIVNPQGKIVRDIDELKNEIKVTERQTLTANQQIMDLSNAINLMSHPLVEKDMDPEVIRLISQGNYSAATTLAESGVRNSSSTKSKYLITLYVLAALNLNLSKATEYAKAAYDESPSKYEYALAYSGALNWQGRSKESKEFLEKLVRDKAFSNGLGNLAIKFDLFMTDYPINKFYHWKKIYALCTIEREGYGVIFAGCKENDEELASLIAKLSKLESEIVMHKSNTKEYYSIYYILCRILSVAYYIRNETHAAYEYETKADELLMTVEERYSPWTALKMGWGMSILNLFHSSQSAQSNLRNLLHLADRAITNNFPTNELQLGQVQEYNAICKATIYLILGIVSEVPYGIHKTRRAFELALATIDNIEDKSIMLKAFEISIMILLYDLYKKENIHQDRLETLVSKLNLSIQEIPDNDFIKKDEITRHICNRNIIGDLCATVASKRSD